MGSRERFSLRGLYLYSVCLITLLVALFSIVEVVRSSVELAYPDPYSVPLPVCDEAGPADVACEKSPSAADSERAAAAQRRWSVLSLVGAATTALFAVPVYAYHWRRIEKDRSEDSLG